MISLGLTGGIAMGKSTVLAQLASLGAKVESADTLAHALMQPKGAAYAQVTAAFPEAVHEGVVDRKILGSIVFMDKGKLKTLESILHPLVREEEQRFLNEARRSGARVAVIEIPLLFESEAQDLFDYTITVHCPCWLQEKRALKRSGMTHDKLASILSHQLPQEIRRKHADFVIHTWLGKAYSLWQLKKMLKKIGA